jgi:Family of unknown function (DUF6232)
MGTSEHDLAVNQPPTDVAFISSEAVFLQDSNALVTNLKCVFSNEPRVYATSGITSVGMESTRQKIVGAALLAGIGLGFLYYRGFVQDAFIVAIPCLIIAFGLYWYGRPWHTLSLHTAGGRYWPLKSREHQYIARVLMAINEAIMRRG